MKTVTILVFTILFNACGSSKASTNLTEANKSDSQETLNGTFSVSEMSVNKLPKNLTLTFDASTNKVNGFSGCNTFFGNYTIKGSSISFKDIVATEKMCLEDVNQAERQMMKVLKKTKNFKIKDNNIVLLNVDKVLLTANKNTTSKMAQDNVKIEYRSHARGNFQNIIIENKTVSVQKGYDAKPVVTTCSDKDWNATMKMITETNLKSFETLEAPSKAHRHDGAPMANFTVTKDGNVFNVPPFDGGNPNKDIESLVNLVLNIAKASKEKN